MVGHYISASRDVMSQSTFAKLLNSVNYVCLSVFIGLCFTDGAFVIGCCSYFQDGLKTIEHFHCYIEELVVQLGRLKQKQDSERRNLVELRNVLRTFMSSYKDVRLCVCVCVTLCVCPSICLFVSLVQAILSC